MDMTSVSSIGPGMDHGADEKMEQVRELLFGAFQRDTATKIEILESRIRELESRIENRLDAIDARIAALAGEVDAAQRTALEEIASGVEELGSRVRKIRPPDHPGG
ncbi:MAG: hypothetical protein AAGC70_11260 [Pseudomonadota bacterium]